MAECDYSKCDGCGIELHASDMTRVGKHLICRRCLPSFAEAIQTQDSPVVARLPMFCRIVFTIDAVFAAFRGAIAIMGIIALVQVFGSQQPERHTLIQGALEVATGLGIMIYGVLGNHMMLRSNNYGFYLGWGNILACIAASAVGLLGIITMNDAIAEQGIPLAAILIVGIFITGIRIVLNIIYAVALMRFKKWFDAQHDG